MRNENVRNHLKIWISAFFINFLQHHNFLTSSTEWFSSCFFCIAWQRREWSLIMILKTIRHIKHENDPKQRSECKMTLYLSLSWLASQHSCIERSKFTFILNDIFSQIWSLKGVILINIIIYSKQLNNLTPVFQVCVCPAINPEFRQKIVNVAVDPRGVWMDPQTTLTMLSRNQLWIQISVSFSCVCPVFGHGFRHKIVKVTVDPRDNVFHLKMDNCSHHIHNCSHQTLNVGEPFSPLQVYFS